MLVFLMLVQNCSNSGMILKQQPIKVSSIVLYAVEDGYQPVCGAVLTLHSI